MATWQFDAQLIPRRSLGRDETDLPAHLEAYEVSEPHAWLASTDEVERVRRLISCILPKGHSWSDQIEVWGYDSGNRIDLLHEKDGNLEVSVRIDTRDETLGFVEQVSALASELECVVVTEDLRITSQAKDLEEAVARSEARRFAYDPKSFLDRLRPV